MQLNAKKTNRTAVILLAVYAVTAGIRFLLAVLTSSYPTVGIDEFLYYSLGRSIATEGRLIFHGQSADYIYILYPLILSPIYLLFQSGAPYFRLLQLWNVLLMSTSVFPLFYLNRAVLKDGKKALVATVIALLLPDFILGEHILSEAIIYPLFFTLMYFAYEYVEQNDWKNLLWIGLLGGLLYSTKPGSVVPAAAFLLFAVIRSVCRKDIRSFGGMIGGILILFGIGFAFYLTATKVFGYSGSVLSIYDNKVSETTSEGISAFLKALATYPYYFILSCGIIGFVYPVMRCKEWEPSVRTFWWIILVCLFGMIVGTAWIINRTEFRASLVHLRYIAMYVPLMITFTSIPPKEIVQAVKKKKKAVKTPIPWAGMAIVAAYVALCTVVFGCKVGSQSTSAFPFFSLSILNDRVLPLSAQIAGNIMIFLLCAGAVTVCLKQYGKKSISAFCLTCMTCLMIINGIFGYAAVRANSSEKLGREGLAVRDIVQDEPYIFILSDETLLDIGVDVNTRNNNYTVLSNDFINNLQVNNGVYVPYVPEATRGMASLSEIPSLNTLVLGRDCYSQFVWSEHVKVEPHDGDTLFVVRFQEGERLVDSTIGNLKKRVLVPNKAGILLVYSDQYMGQPLKVRMEIESTVAQKMTMNSTHELVEIDLKEGRDWYEAVFNKPEDAYNFIVKDGYITVYTYKLVTMP